MNYVTIWIYAIAVLVYLLVYNFRKKIDSRIFIWLPLSFAAGFLLEITTAPILAWILFALVVVLSAMDEAACIHFHGPIHVILTVVGFAGSLAAAVFVHFHYENAITLFFSDGTTTAIRNLFVMLLLWCAVIQSASLIIALCRKILPEKFMDLNSVNPIQSAFVDENQVSTEVEKIQTPLEAEQKQISTEAEQNQMPAEAHSNQASAGEDQEQKPAEEEFQTFVDKIKSVKFFRLKKDSIAGLIPYYVIFGLLFIYIFGNLINTLMIDEHHVDTFVDLLKMYLCSANAILNVYLVLGISLSLVCLLGVNLGCFLSMLAVLLVLLANYIKVSYHATFFSWLDMLSIKEGILILEDFLTTDQMILIGIAVVVLLALLIWNIRRIGRLLMPHPRPVCAIPILAVTVFYIFSLWNEYFKPIDIYLYTCEDAIINVQNNGIFIHLLYDYKNLKEAFMDKPADYSEEKSEEMKAEFEKLGTEIQERKAKTEKTKKSFAKKTSTDAADVENPDIILILSESLFDLEAVPGLNLDADINPTIEKYRNTQLISPRYGGYTSAVEFEVLTGMSLAFLPEGIIPYTTYFNYTSKSFPSIVQNLNANGYYTEAIHPNLGTFYNRETVYKNLQFDIFKTNEAFGAPSKEYTTENGWITDKTLGQVIINELKDDTIDAPRFIFGITMEGHYVTQDKYLETDVHVQNDSIDEDQKHQLEQQAQSYKNADKMIKKLIKYMQNTDRPTLLYVFGDHLAPLEYLTTSHYIDDVDCKYTTAFVRYSNYKELETVDKMSTNQIAACIMEDSGVKHDSYFDYIYSLQQTYPVLQKEYVDVTDEDFDTYRYIQYDVMFGKHYLSDY